MAVAHRDNTNLAYDLSRFDSTAREQRERERAEEEKQRRQIRIAPHSVSKTGSIFKIFSVTVVLFAALCAVNWSSTTKDDMARKVTQQQALLDNAKDDNALLQSKLDSKVNISYIEQYATDELGMEKVSSAQKKYISVNTESLIEVDEDESEGFFGSIKKWFSDTLEFLGF